MRSNYLLITPYLTKDGSEIRELMHPLIHGNHSQSLAEATIPAGVQTLLHRHLLTEEIYHITCGSGLMTLGVEQFVVHQGDTICIVPGTPHRIQALDNVLTLLCCCSPAYCHDDTELLEN